MRCDCLSPYVFIYSVHAEVVLGSSLTRSVRCEESRRALQVSVELLELHNLYRDAAGVDPLRWSNELADLAAAYAGCAR